MEPEKRETDRRETVGHTRYDILEAAERLTRLVQTGRYVSKEQMRGDMSEKRHRVIDPARAE
jgi:hypothetical protein